jgi:hypothetical protein
VTAFRRRVGWVVVALSLVGLVAALMAGDFLVALLYGLVAVYRHEIICLERGR